MNNSPGHRPASPNQDDVAQSDAQLQMLFQLQFELSPIPATVMAMRDRRYVASNQAFEQAIGLRHDEVIGQHALDVTFWVDLADRDRRVAELIAHGSIRDFEFAYRTGAGSVGIALGYLDIITMQGEQFLLGKFIDITERKRAEQARELLAAIVDASDDAIISVSLAQQILTWNAGATRTFGYTADEMIGRSIRTLRPADSDDGIDALYAQLRQGLPVPHFETVRQRKDGALIDVMLIVSPMRNSRGELTGFATNSRDITALKASERSRHHSEQLYRTLAQHFPNGAVFLFDHDLRFSIADGAALSGAGLSREMVEGRLLQEVLGPEGYTNQAPLYRAALAGISTTNEITTGDRTYMTYYLPVRNDEGEIFAGMAVSHEITDRKRAELALVAERGQLTTRIVAATSELSAANAELARASRLKDEFLANMSHELRTPLNAILGRSELLREQLHGPLNSKQQQDVGSIAEAGQHLLELINDILDLSKIEAGHADLELSVVQADTLCRSATRMVAQQAAARRLSVRIAMDGALDSFIGDERRLKQILVNLLSNAVKFTPEGGKVGLDVQSDAAAGTITFAVWDTGLGISAEDQRRLFRPFVQVDSSMSRQTGGTGLGLALVLRLAELHGGSVALESAPGEGSRFSVTIPWVAAQGAELPAILTAGFVGGPPLAIHRALLVEDSRSTIEQLSHYLGEHDSQVVVHEQGEGVVARARELQPDLIVLDILLPDRSGWDVLSQLKADPQTAAIPVLVVSVVDDPERARAMGAVAFVRKPLTRDSFHGALDSLGAVAPAPPSAPTPLALLVRPSAEPGPLVLVADDNEGNIVIVTDYLTSAGYSVAVARNGAEAVEQTNELRPALIIMDVQMPVLDGLEAIRRIRAAGLHDLPIIALTALAMRGDRERCLAAGADIYMAKPLNLRLLATTIAALLGIASDQAN